MHITNVRESYQSLVISMGLRSLCFPAAFFTFRKLPSYLFVCIGSFTPSLAHSLLHWLICSSLAHSLLHWFIYFHRLTHSLSDSSDRIQALETSSPALRTHYKVGVMTDDLIVLFLRLKMPQSLVNTSGQLCLCWFQGGLTKGCHPHECG